jgi:flagellar assembly protein FliH
MLCSIVDENEVEVGEVPWRQKNEPRHVSFSHAAASDTGASSDSGASNEIVRLRAELDQSRLLMEKRAKEAWENGLRAGEAAARKSLDEQVRAKVELLANTVAEVSSARAENIKRAEADTVRLAIEIARRVLYRELSVDPSALEALIKAAIAKLQTQEIYRVRVHPDLEPLMRSCLEQAGRGSAVEIVCDRGQPKGGASFEISRGALDASVDTQLREIEYGLADEIRRRAT